MHEDVIEAKSAVYALSNRSTIVYTVVPWLICGLGVLFYIYEYFLRIGPSVMTFELMRAFNVNGLALGNLTAFYYYAYTPMQIPVGVLLDKYGPRRVLTVACLACALGSYLFATTTNLGVAEFGRFMIGFGSAFAFVGVLKLATIWLPADRFALIAGLTSGLGTIGAMFGDIELSKLVTRVGWQQTTFLSSLLGIALALAMFLWIRDKNQHRTPVTSAELAAGNDVSFRELFITIGKLLRNPQMWIIGLIGCLLYLPASAFAELWGIHYLRAVYHYSDVHASSIVAFMFFGYVFGAPLFGFVSDKIKRRRLPVFVGGILATVAIGMILFLPHLSAYALYALMFVFGFAYGAQAIVFAIAHELYSNQIAATVLALTNMFVMLGGVIFQPVIGKLLDLQWNGMIYHGMHIYNAQNYKMALIVLPICLFIGAMLVWTLKETGSLLQNNNSRNRIKH